MPRPQGRPPKEIDWKQFEAMCAIHCTHEEICAILDVAINTLDRQIKKKYGKSFGQIYKEKTATGKRSLRHNMWQKALQKNDNTMMLFLAKNHLGMSDKVEERIIQDKPVDVQIVWSSTPKPVENVYDEPVQEEEDLDTVLE